MSIMKSMKNKAVYLAAGTTAMLASATVFAQETTPAPTDLSSLTNAVDFSTVITAVLAVGASLMGLYVAWKGAQFVIRAVRGA